MRRAVIAIALPLSLVLTACSSGPGTTPGISALEVSATYYNRIRLLPDHELTVRVEDVSRADAPAVVLVEETQSLAGREPPYGVSIDIQNSRIDPAANYAVRAEIRDLDGVLIYTSDIRYPVLTRGAPNRADIILVDVR
jgi:putative lipoprotein